jgi:hypothetical protein
MRHADVFMRGGTMAGIGSRQESAMFKFTIRDLLWLMLLVALAVGWWIEHRYWEQRRLRNIADPYHAIMEDSQEAISGD